ncbi:ubiquitin-conjugating enzyme [Emydomyces testavorans]|uniref:Ubiquitin-conjugating enzyme n=1 Tax=Emydomyces testavorans TaxID=2070801 RepID=A0AAF0DI21_9EURO|nr:ubiquitin-conjugating enzyme [Emydomyces testavorans]
MANQAILRIGREISQLQQGTDLSCQEEDIRHVKAMIIGPAGTPYEFGFFEFTIEFPKDYPASPPKVESVTTNGGRCRFNPNIYACGKIYSRIYHESIRISVIQRLEDALGIQTDGTVASPSNKWSDEMDEDEDGKPPFEPFRDLCKRRFLWYYESYMNIIKEQDGKTTVGTRFERMPFEGSGNSMEGRFNYPELKKRLTLIRDVIMKETDSWAAEGLKAKANDTRISVSLQRQYEQIVEDLKAKNNFTIDISLDNSNPFVWQLTYFGRPMTHLDGGIFRIKICLSPHFPEEQPRVLVQTSLFHHRVSKDGTLCYFCRKTEDMKSHVEAIVGALEDESPRYDPRATVNPEASKLFWGSPEQKKQYNRLLRRSAQRSIEYVESRNNMNRLT